MSANSAGTTRCARRTCSTPCWPGLQAGGFFDIPGIPPIEALQYPLAMPGTNGNVEFNTLASTAAPPTVSNSWSDTSPRAVLDYKLTPDTMIYGSVTRGYQAGGYNFALPASHYEPETVWNYEAGIKSYFPQYHLLFNASAYYYKFSNLQSLSLVSNGNGNLPLYLVTISDQEAHGLEAEMHWQATEGLRLNFAGAYIDATYKDYVASDGVDLSGQPTGEPKWSAAGGLDYIWHQVFGGDLDFTLQHAYRGPTRCNSDSYVQGSCISIPAFKIGTSTNRTDLRLCWSPADASWTVALFVNNLFDNQYVTGVNKITATTLGTPFVNITPPRTWGVEAAVHFRVCANRRRRSARRRHALAFCVVRAERACFAGTLAATCDPESHDRPVDDTPDDLRFCVDTRVCAAYRAGSRDGLLRAGPRRRRRHDASVHGRNRERAGEAQHCHAALPVSVHGECVATARSAERCARGRACRRRRGGAPVAAAAADCRRQVVRWPHDVAGTGGDTIARRERPRLPRLSSASAEGARQRARQTPHRRERADAVPAGYS
jgi:hypothetical protein